MADKIENLIQENEHNKARAKSAEARSDLAEARIIELQARIDMLELEIIKQHHIASACAEAEA